MVGFEHYGMGWVMILVWLIPLVLISLVVSYVIRDRSGKSGRTALDILEERYARGEVDRDEFMKRRTDLAE